VEKLFSRSQSGQFAGSAFAELKENGGGETGKGDGTWESTQRPARVPKPDVLAKRKKRGPTKGRVREGREDQHVASPAKAHQRGTLMGLKYQSNFSTREGKQNKLPTSSTSQGEQSHEQKGNPLKTKNKREIM